MPHWICETCGVQFPDEPEPPAECAICQDERQYVGWGGQRWTTLEQMRERYRNEIRDDHGLTGIGTEPRFAIAQRALLVPGAEGNVMWDCITLLDDATVDAVRERGGLRAIAISHPHYYSTLAEWARALDAPVYLHADDREWVMRPDERIVFWEGETLDIGEGVTLIRLGGHFAGGTVLHVGDKLLSGDIVQVVQDRRHVSFMYSYPNVIPLDAATVMRMVDALEPFDFARIHGAWWDLVIPDGGKEAVRRSARRYVAAIEP